MNLTVGIQILLPWLLLKYINNDTLQHIICLICCRELFGPAHCAVRMFRHGVIWLEEIVGSTGQPGWVNREEAVTAIIPFYCLVPITHKWESARGNKKQQSVVTQQLMLERGAPYKTNAFVVCIHSQAGSSSKIITLGRKTGLQPHKLLMIIAWGSGSVSMCSGLSFTLKFAFASHAR